MGSINVIEATVDTQISTTHSEDDFVEVVRTSNLTLGKDYYVICTASVEASDADLLFEWRLYDHTNTRLIADSTTIREAGQTGVGQSYYYVGKITAGSAGIPNNGIAFQQKGYSTTSPSGYKPASTNFLSMLVLDMSEIDDGNYFFATEQNNAQVQDTFQDRVTHTITGVEEDDEWLVFAWTMYYMNNASHSIISRLACDDEPVETIPAPSILFEGEDTGEELGWWWSRGYTLTGDSDSVEWKIEDKRETSGTTNHHYCKRTTLFGIKTSAFPSSSIQYSGENKSPTNYAFFNVMSKIFTPVHTGKVIAVASSVVNLSGTVRKASMRMMNKTVPIPNDAPDSVWFINTNDGTDILPLSYVTMYDGVVGQSTEIHYDVKSSINTDDAVFTDMTLALLGVNAAIVPITFSAVAKQVYTSGAVASETFDAGSKASQTLSSGDVAGQGFASGDTASQSHSGGDVEAEANP